MQDLCNESEAEDELHYAHVHFSKNQSNPVYANPGLAGLHRDNVEEEEAVEYASVTFDSARAAQRWATFTVTLSALKPQNDVEVFTFITFIAVTLACFVYMFT